MIREGTSTFSRVIRYLLCSFVYFYKGLFSKDVDLIFLASTPPTMGLIGGLLKKIRKIPVVYVLQDIFPDSLISTGVTNRGSLLWEFGSLIEKFTYKNVDNIIVPSNNFKSNLLTKNVPIEKIYVILNWVDERSIFPTEKSDNDLFDKFGLNRNNFFVTYNGNLGLTQNIDMLIELSKDLEKYENLKFVLVGDGANKENLVKEIDTQNISNVKILPFQDYSDISKVFGLGDVGLVISKANVGVNSIPSKTWSIMLAEKPVLASFDLDSELCSIIKEANCGMCVPPDDPESLKNAIIHLYNNQELRNKMGRNGRDFVINNLSRCKSTSKYIQVINQCFENSSIIKIKQ
jgi:glycosyltransferase involved in cell wall biosynthesis